MSIAERDRHRQALLRLKEQMLAGGDIAIEPNRRDPAVVGGDEDEQALNEMNQSIASSRNKARSGSRAKIEAALARLEQSPDEFGLCQECEEPIEAGRLTLMPYVEYCVECQRSQDGMRRPSTRRHVTDYR